MLEDKIADIWPDYPCLYDVRSRDFKNRVKSMILLKFFGVPNIQFANNINLHTLLLFYVLKFNVSSRTFYWRLSNVFADVAKVKEKAKTSKKSHLE